MSISLIDQKQLDEIKNNLLEDTSFDNNNIYQNSYFRNTIIAISMIAASILCFAILTTHPFPLNVIFGTFFLKSLSLSAVHINQVIQHRNATYIAGHIGEFFKQNTIRVDWDKLKKRINRCLVPDLLEYKIIRLVFNLSPLSLAIFLGEKTITYIHPNHEKLKRENAKFLEKVKLEKRKLQCMLLKHLLQNHILLILPTILNIRPRPVVAIPLRPVNMNERVAAEAA